FVPMLGLFLLSTLAFRDLLWRPGFWIMCLTGAACCVPILVWNHQHSWVSLRHVSGQAGLSESPGLRWAGPLTYSGLQFALLLGFWFLAWMAALVRFRPWRAESEGIAYL